MAEARKVQQAVKLPRRRPDGHKGNYGRVLVVGGSRGMIGAAALASNSAMRSGAGLVTFAAPETIQLAVAGLCPCATSVPLACDPDGGLARLSVRQVADAASKCDVLAVGPGMGTSSGAGELVRLAIQQDKPVVLDADGLNNLAKMEDWPALRRCPLVLTPHPGEFARLTGKGVQDIQADRQAAALAAAREWSDQFTAKGPPLVCVLKGAASVVTDGDRIYVNDTGNPGMATGGSGDVLTGAVAALMGQGLAPFEAACLAVRVHGRAGDLAAERLGEVSLTAWDLLDFLPQAFVEASS
jgi:NAD(P)H-hydrate epimerase